MQKHATGRLLYLMGPSGSGKDSLLHHIKALQGQHEGQKSVHIATRHITRKASNAQNAMDEQHHAVSEQEFLLALAAGQYVLHWQSHGLHYGIHKDIDTLLGKGAVVIVNGSRAYLPEALKIYPALIPILITVDTNVLQARLEGRGRESEEDIAKRIERAHMDMAELKALPQVEYIDNSGKLETACTAFELCIAKYM